jgi:hypothetical protein
MQLKTYNHIKDNIDKLDIDYTNGLIKNRAVQTDDRGYPAIKIAYKYIRIHNIIIFLTHNDKCIDKEVNHIDGDKFNNSPGNLELVTRSENMQHAFDTGLFIPVKGSKHGKSKLNEDLVRNIKIDLKSGMRNMDIVNKHGVTKDDVTNIKLNRCWVHVTI